MHAMTDAWEQFVVMDPCRYKELEMKVKQAEAERQRRKKEKEQAKKEQEAVLGKGGKRPKLSFSLA